jgi:hypothetical protein
MLKSVGHEKLFGLRTLGFIRLKMNCYPSYQQLSEGMGGSAVWRLNQWHGPMDILPI